MSGITEYTVADIYDYIDQVISCYMLVVFLLLCLHLIMFLGSLSLMKYSVFYVAQGERICFKIFCFGDLQRIC